MGRQQPARSALRMSAARRCGFECWHPAMTLDQAMRSVQDTGGALLTGDQGDAYRELLPGSWRAAFAAGWQSAASAAAGV